MTSIGFSPWQGVYLTFLPLKLYLHCCEGKLKLVCK